MVEFQMIVYEPKIWTLYIHENKINNKKYVGITSVNPNKRWANGNGYSDGQYISKAIKKYGWENFNHIILYNQLTCSEACFLEKLYIKQLNTKFDQNGYNISDGGFYIPKNKKTKKSDITGITFGRLTVKKYVGIFNSYDRNDTFWLCDCSCGNKKILPYEVLVSGNTQSCGCAQKERIKEIGLNNKDHGLSKTKLYSYWHNVKKRDNAKNNICSEWDNNFINFYNWAIENGYQDGYRLVLIDEDKSYQPHNCEWVSPTIYNQYKNPKLKFYEYNGEIKTVREFSEQYNIKYQTLIQRLHRNGYDIKKALELNKGGENHE